MSEIMSEINILQAYVDISKSIQKSKQKSIQKSNQARTFICLRCISCFSFEGSQVAFEWKESSKPKIVIDELFLAV